MLIDILLGVLIVTATALCIYILFSLKRLNKSVESLQKDVHHLYEKTLPLLDNLTEITERASKVTSEAEHYWSEISESVERVKEKFSNFGKSSGKSTSQNPIEEFIRNLRAISSGIAAFWSSFKK